MNNQFLNHLNSITPQGRARETSIFVPKDELNELFGLFKSKKTPEKKAAPELSHEDHFDPNTKAPIHPIERMRRRANADHREMTGSNKVKHLPIKGVTDEYGHHNPHEGPHPWHFVKGTGKLKTRTSKQFPGLHESTDLMRSGFASHPGLPKKAARKYAYALERGNNLGTARERWMRKHVSNERRLGPKIDAALAAFSKRTGIALKETPKYAQDAIPAVPELLMLTYSNKDRSKEGMRKFVGKGKRNPQGLSEEGEENEESTKSMIARLVARGHKKLGKAIPKDVLRDIEKKHKTKEDDYEDD